MALRVALWGPLPPPAGGLTRWVQNYLAAAPAAGIEAEVIDSSPRAAGVDTTSRFRPARVLRATHSLLQLRRVLAQRRPDVVHLCTTLFWATAREGLALELCHRAGVPSVLHVHMSTQIIAWHRALRWPSRQGVRAVIERASAVVTMSEELNVYLQDLLPDGRIVYIPNPVNTDRFYPAAAPGLADRPLRVLFAGLIAETKGFLELARAVLAVDGVTLVVAGSRSIGSTAESDRRIEHALGQLERQGRLELLGDVPAAAMPATYRDVDVFCLPSHAEGLPNALLEAMACGLPCVITPVGGMLGVVEGESGPAALVVPVGDETALAGALRSLRDAPPLRARLGAAARQRAVCRYTSRTVVEEYAALYARLRGANAVHHRALWA
ncbi:glycosyltransferase [Sorangium cellulosum]|uniref:Glycosyltransferase n=1 Tax=Sorangium cellulosum TaxID=56 RepID=A0A2L0EJB6_SORCE|nr:glycosyltransferase family 4 protein [Sorangium cellulosum]AUX39392.1 glycosyltransferase [Sorangium cellulosum]